MTNRERALAALNHEQPDKTPYSISFTQPAHASLAEYYGDPAFEDKLENCLVDVAPEREDAWTEVEPDVWQDPFGVRWDKSVDKDIGVVCNCLITPDSFDDYVWPDPDDPARYVGVEEQVAAKPDALVVGSIGFSLFERAWTLAGMEAVLVAMIADKPFVNRLLDRIVAFNLRLVENLCRYDIDAVYFGDDWGSQRGVLMGEDLWREFIKPRLREMYGAAKAHGKFVFQHSCGKVDTLFPDLIECGLDVFNPFQPEVIDVFEAKRRYGGRLCFHGGISTQRTLPYATPDEVRAEVRRLIAEIGRNGGYIAAPAHAIPADAKPENIAAMIDELANQAGNPGP